MARKDKDAGRKGDLDPQSMTFVTSGDEKREWKTTQVKRGSESKSLLKITSTPRFEDRRETRTEKVDDADNKRRGRFKNSQTTEEETTTVVKYCTTMKPENIIISSNSMTIKYKRRQIKRNQCSAGFLCEICTVEVVQQVCSNTLTLDYNQTPSGTMIGFSCLTFNPNTKKCNKEFLELKTNVIMALKISTFSVDVAVYVSINKSTVAPAATLLRQRSAAPATTASLAVTATPPQSRLLPNNSLRRQQSRLLLQQQATPSSSHSCSPQTTSIPPQSLFAPATTTTPPAVTAAPANTLLLLSYGRSCNNNYPPAVTVAPATTAIPPAVTVASCTTLYSASVTAAPATTAYSAALRLLLQQQLLPPAVTVAPATTAIPPAVTLLCNTATPPSSRSHGCLLHNNYSASSHGCSATQLLRQPSRLLLHNYSHSQAAPATTTTPHQSRLLLQQQLLSSITVVPEQRYSAAVTVCSATTAGLPSHCYFRTTSVITNDSAHNSVNSASLLNNCFNTNNSTVIPSDNYYATTNCSSPDLYCGQFLLVLKTVWNSTHQYCQHEIVNGCLPASMGEYPYQVAVLSTVQNHRIGPTTAGCSGASSSLNFQGDANFSRSVLVAVLLQVFCAEDDIPSEGKQ
ncbi:mucin-2-like [Penaeus indicus]|uniref:mucin-2-like n=1 Tax=Penaeus indicus TaxID=29960 RepID=UPI00300CB8D6